jgi:hypothetical protein
MEATLVFLQRTDRVSEVSFKKWLSTVDAMSAVMEKVDNSTSASNNKRLDAMSASDLRQMYSPTPPASSAISPGISPNERDAATRIASTLAQTTKSVRGGPVPNTQISSSVKPRDSATTPTQTKRSARGTPVPKLQSIPPKQLASTTPPRTPFPSLSNKPTTVGNPKGTQPKTPIIPSLDFLTNKFNKPAISYRTLPEFYTLLDKIGRTSYVGARCLETYAEYLNKGCCSDCWITGLGVDIGGEDEGVADARG